MVVTYVATADNYRDKFTKLEQQKRSADSLKADAEKQLEEANRARDALKADLDTQIAALKSQVAKLDLDLNTLTRAKAQLDQEVTGMMATVRVANTGEQEQRGLFQAESKKVEQFRADQIARDQELKETNQMLLEKMTIIAGLDATVRRLTEENQELGTRLNQYLAQSGRTAVRPQTTVPVRAAGVQPVPTAPSQTKDIGLNGRIKVVDVKTGLAEISIGSAAGVKPDMKFHVIRGDRFVADIVIVEVWPETAVGSLQLIQPGVQPQTGDKIATNL
ncbi:MAG: hypothetical protein A2Y77_10155 [Planctomycetes bacterium RBG_13_62_9]|nr:MAG: hypothetical protein A2Y77_10155 [Planctomycetes bacterium RBG_13_62_9]